MYQKWIKKYDEYMNNNNKKELLKILVNKIKNTPDEIIEKAIDSLSKNLMGK